MYWPRGLLYLSHLVLLRPTYAFFPGEGDRYLLREYICVHCWRSWPCLSNSPLWRLSLTARGTPCLLCSATPRTPSSLGTSTTLSMQPSDMSGTTLRIRAATSSLVMPTRQRLMGGFAR